MMPTVWNGFFFAKRLAVCGFAYANDYTPQGNGVKRWGEAGHDVADDGQDQRACHAAKGARDHPRRYQQMVAGRQRAKERADGKAGIEAQQRPPAVKAIQVQPGGEA